MAFLGEPWKETEWYSMNDAKIDSSSISNNFY